MTLVRKLFGDSRAKLSDHFPLLKGEPGDKDLDITPASEVRANLRAVVEAQNAAKRGAVAVKAEGSGGR